MIDKMKIGDLSVIHCPEMKRVLGTSVCTNWNNVKEKETWQVYGWSKSSMKGEPQEEGEEREREREKRERKERDGWSPVLCRLVFLSSLDIDLRY